MQQESNNTSLETLQEIRSIMDRSARFISLSGWSGVWAGAVALAGSCIAYSWLQQPAYAVNADHTLSNPAIINIILLAAGVFATALAGGFYFTYKKAHSQSQNMWSSTTKKLAFQLFFPLAAGGAFTLALLQNGAILFIVPASLAFYGLGLMSAGKYTLSDIQYLGISEVLLACICLLFPAYGLYFWAFGFGVLHILYGIVMWNKYDKTGGHE